MHACVVKLNGWPETFDERIRALADAVDHVTLVRSKPNEGTTALRDRDDVSVYDVPPGRGSYVEPELLKPVVFALHVFVAIVVVGVVARRRDVDVVHALDYVLGGAACAVVAAVFGLPFVVSVRGLKEPRYRSVLEERGTLLARTKFRILTALTGRIVPRADHVVTKAAYQETFVRNTFGTSAACTTIPTGVDFETFDPARIDGRDAICDIDPDAIVDPDDTKVLYLSKLVPEKGPDRVIEYACRADDELPDDISVVVVGETRSNSYGDRLRELREKCPERVVLVPRRVPFEDVPKLVADADAVVLFSEPNAEGTPRILQEACAMATPIIAPAVTGIVDEFRDLPGCYLVDRDSPAEFRDAVLEVAGGSQPVDRERCRDRFDISRNYARYREVYEDAVRSLAKG